MPKEFLPNDPGDTVDYEPPSPEERRAMDHGETMPGVSVIHTDMQATRVPMDDGPMPDMEALKARAMAREVRDEQRRQQSNRLTALHLAVEWTADDRDQVVQVGQLLGFADLFVQYVETGKKPTQAEFQRAMRLYR